MALTEREKNVLSVGLILAGLCIAVFIYVHWALFSPQIRRNEATIKKTEETTRALEKELAGMKAFLQNRKEVEAMRNQLAVAARKLPSEPESLEFLKELRASLERTGMKQTRVAPKPFVPRALYTEIPYEVQGSARYHEFGQFLNLIECNPRRFMRVNSFDIKNSGTRPTIHPVTVGISTFMFNKSE